MRAVICISVSVLLCGCAGSFSEERLAGAPRDAVSIDPPECAAIDSARRDWGAAAKGAAVLGGGTGLSAIPVTDRNARIGIVTAGAAVGVFAAIAGVEADSFAASWVRQCGGTGAPGTPARKSLQDPE